MELPQFHVHAAIEERHWWFLGRRAITRALLHRMLPPSKETFILDVGCGTGGMTAALAQEYSCAGIDPIPEAVALARKRFPSIDFRCGDVPDDCRDLLGRADAVTIFDVLEHVADDFLFVSSLLSVMKPGALLLMVAPHDPALWGMHDRGFDHYRRYTVARFREIWEGLPVREHVISPFNARLYPLARFLRFWSRVRGTSLGPASTDLALPFRPLNALLTRIFAGEQSRLLQVLDGTAGPFIHGVSILGLIERRPGDITPRARPDHVPADERPWLPVRQGAAEVGQRR